jgi:hypothetical protein
LDQIVINEIFIKKNRTKIVKREKGNKGYGRLSDSYFAEATEDKGGDRAMRRLGDEEIKKVTHGTQSTHRFSQRKYSLHLCVHQ